MVKIKITLINETSNFFLFFGNQCNVWKDVSQKLNDSKIIKWTRNAVRFIQFLSTSLTNTELSCKIRSTSLPKIYSFFKEDAPCWNGLVNLLSWAVSLVADWGAHWRSSDCWIRTNSRLHVNAGRVLHWSQRQVNCCPQVKV